MGTVDMASFDALLKKRYTDEAVKSLVYKDRPFLARLRKGTDFYGKEMPVPLQYGTGKGRATSIALARANVGAGDYEQFNVKRRKNYGVVVIDRETMKASEADKGAWLAARATEIDGMMTTVMNALDVDLWGNGGGARGQVASLAGGVLTLKNPDDVVHFEKGMTIVASATDGTTGTVRVGKAVIDAVDRDLGKLHSSTWGNINPGGTPPGPEDDDFLFVEGDFGKVVQGVRAWLPWASPTPGQLFNGVDRSQDPSRLSGVRFDGSGFTSIKEAIQRGIARMHREGAHPSDIWLDHATYTDLSLSLQDKAIYDIAKAHDADIGFKSLQFVTPKGMVNVMAAMNAPSGFAYALDMETWKLWTLGPCPDLQNDDGSTMLRERDDDAYELRISYYGNLVCTAPGSNGIFKLP